MNLRLAGVVAILGCFATSTNGRTNTVHHVDFQIPSGVSVYGITVTRIEENPLRTAKSPMMVNWKERLLQITNAESISTYIGLTKAIRVIGSTPVDTIEKAQLLGQEPRWLICVSGSHTNISPEQRKYLSDGDTSFCRYYRVYGAQLCGHHPQPQHPDLYVTEGDGVSNLVQFIERVLGNQKQPESHNKVQDTAHKLADPQH